PDGRLLAIDRDPEAVIEGEALARDDERFEIERGNFGELRGLLEERDWMGKVDGILLDVGVSSPQLDDARRGFSFSDDGPLDMRMDPSAGQSARDFVNSATEEQIRTVLHRYGEERAAPRIARAICARRQERPIETTAELAGIVESVVRRKAGAKHPATKTFQAIRIFINDELEALRAGLSQAAAALAPGGRLCVISFHSLEDRIVKRFLRDNSRVDPALSRLPEIPPAARPRLRLPSKAVRAGADELVKNPRARSATLRVGERLA
ncbi:MAG: 16S rRNA (cytosine(1402)-N(4))-methyltransferase RsmH, partial [Gammaproteobacteria bacterium]|nr:16S rRNA (cytosine(1402)-N(4))-methyltransferase RsmH [Gammaproteobacteria bacterium]